MIITKHNPSVDMTPKSYQHEKVPITIGDIQVLIRNPLLRHILKVRLDEFMSGVFVLAGRDGAAIYERGDGANNLLIVIEGAIELTVPTSTGHHALVEVLAPGGCFGEEAFVRGQRLTTARSIGKTRLVAFDPTVLTFPSQQLVEHFCSRLAWMTEEIMALKAVAPMQRLARLLLAHVDGENGSANAAFPLKKTVAARLGIDPASLSRLLRQLKTLGVSINGNTVLVRDVAALRAVAEQAATIRGVRLPAPQQTDQ